VEIRMSHMRNVLLLLEKAGYTLRSIGFEGADLHVEIYNPCDAGNKEFLEDVLKKTGTGGA